MYIISTDVLFIGNGKFARSKSIRLSDEGRILEVMNGIDPKAIAHYAGLCPGFINAHCHTELSHLKGLIPESTGLPGFIDAVQSLRDVSELTQKTAQEEALKAMQKSGIVGLGDICNSALGIKEKSKSNIRTHNFIELFGFNPADADAHLKRGVILKKLYEDNDLSASLSPHAPYSVSHELMSHICSAEPGLMSIHLQECMAEDEMFQSGTGDLVAQLEKFGIDFSNWQTPETTSLNSLLNVFAGKKVLFVHATNSNEKDVKSATGEGLEYFCTCPNANIYIENQLPDYPMLMQNYAKILVGTDSLASNHQLNIWSELETIKTHFPHIRIEELIGWACQNGAEFFGWDDLGSIEEGKKPGIIALRRNGSSSIGFSVQKRLI